MIVVGAEYMVSIKEVLKGCIGLLTSFNLVPFERGAQAMLFKRCATISFYLVPSVCS